MSIKDRIEQLTFYVSSNQVKQTGKQGEKLFEVIDMKDAGDPYWTSQLLLVGGTNAALRRYQEIALGLSPECLRPIMVSALI